MNTLHGVATHTEVLTFSPDGDEFAVSILAIQEFLRPLPPSRLCTAIAHQPDTYGSEI